MHLSMKSSWANEHMVQPVTKPFWHGFTPDTSSGTAAGLAEGALGADAIKTQAWRDSQEYAWVRALKRWKAAR